MRIRMNTTLMHPRLGAVSPGQVIDLPDEEARPLLEGGNVVGTFRGDGVLCETAPAASRVEETRPLSTAPKKIDELSALRHLRPR
jgi:hypothetical protein